MDPFKKLDPVNLNQAKDIILQCFDINWSVNLVSSPGVGKSSAVKQVCEDRNLLMVDRRLTSMVPEDVNGLPDFYENEQGVRVARYAPMDFWPLEGTPLPINPKTDKPYDGWCLFLDEFNGGTPAMQAASYRVILDRETGMGNKLHEQCRIVTAGNLMTDNAITYELGTATQSRLTHVPVKVCHETFMYYADENGFDPRVKAFLNFKPGNLHKFDPNHDDLTFPCPRTWETTSRLIKNMGSGPVDRNNRPVLSGTIGTGMATEFVNFTRVWQELPTLSSIASNPEGTPMPSEPSVRHAIAGMIGEGLTEFNADDLMKFVLRMSPDFQVITLRAAVGRNPKLLAHQAIGTWMKTNRTRLIRKEAA